MEDIIIWIVIVAIGATVEYLKKKRGSDSTSASMTSESSANNRNRHQSASRAPRTAPAPFIPEPYVPEPARSESWGEPLFSPSPAKQSATAPKAKAAGKPAAASGKSTTASGKSTPKSKTAPTHGYQPLAISPDPKDEGPSMPSAQAADENRLRDEAEQARLKAHYDRWRQAILDTQVLERKF